MIRGLTGNKVIWFLLAVLSLVAALAGVFKPEIYANVVSPEVMPGVLSQDMTTIVVSLVMLFLVFTVREEQWKAQAVLLGIVYYLFYAYGIYAIERLYNAYYFVYMAIFGLSFYSLIFSLANLRLDRIHDLKQIPWVRNIAVGFSLLMPVIFYPLWIMQLLPLMQEGVKIEFMYSIFILDLAIVLPSLAIIAVLAAKNRGIGLYLLPAVFVKGFTLLLPVGIGELLKPAFNQPVRVADAILYLSIAAVFLLLAALYLKKLTLANNMAARG